MAFLSRFFGRRQDDREPSERREPMLQQPGVWSFGPFSLAALPGFAYVSGQTPAVYSSGSGDTALISVYVLDGTPSPTEARPIIANAKKQVSEIFSSSAARFGASGEVQERTQDSGDLLLSWPIATSDKPDAEYLLQHAVVSPIGNLAIITVEGRGDPANAATAMEASIATARFAI